MKAVYFLRSLLFATGQISTLVVFSVLGQLTRPFSVQTRYAFIHKWALFCVWWLQLTCGVKYRVHLDEEIDTSRAGLILARHESAWETLFLQKLFPRQAYVLKQELLKIPFFGWGMALLNPIAIDRSAGRQALKQILKDGTERLNSGDWVVLFPEGTRMSPNELGKINVGGAMLAKQAQAPVYIVTHNAGECWPKNGFIKQPGTIDVYVKKAIQPDELSLMSAADINAQIEQWYTEHFKK